MMPSELKTQKISKNQQKKQLKKQKHKETAHLWKKAKKERRRLKKHSNQVAKPQASPILRDTLKCGSIIFDCSYEPLMKENVSKNLI